MKLCMSGLWYRTDSDFAEILTILLLICEYYLQFALQLSNDSTFSIYLCTMHRLMDTGI